MPRNLFLFREPAVWPGNTDNVTFTKEGDLYHYTGNATNGVYHVIWPPKQRPQLKDGQEPLMSIWIKNDSGCAMRLKSNDGKNTDVIIPDGAEGRFSLLFKNPAMWGQLQFEVQSLTKGDPVNVWVKEPAMYMDGVTTEYLLPPEESETVGSILTQDSISI